MHYVSQTEIGSRRWTVFSQDSWAAPEIWDIDANRLLWRGESPTERSWIYEYGGQQLLLNVYFGAFFVLRLRAGERGTLTAEPIGASVPIAGDDFTGTIGLSGRMVILSSQFNHVRVWDVEDLLQMALSGGPTAADALAAGTLATTNGLPGVLLAGAPGRVVLLDEARGTTIGEWKLDRDETPAAIDAAPNPAHVVVGTYNGRIHVFDVRTGEKHRTIEAGRWLARLRTIRWSGRNLVFASVENGFW